MIGGTLEMNFLDLDTIFLTIFRLIKKVNKKPKEVIKLKKMVKWKIKKNKDWVKMKDIKIKTKVENKIKRLINKKKSVKRAQIGTKMRYFKIPLCRIFLWKVREYSRSEGVWM
jgi:hypothetical protein